MEIGVRKILQDSEYKIGEIFSGRFCSHTVNLVLGIYIDTVKGKKRQGRGMRVGGYMLLMLNVSDYLA